MSQIGNIANWDAVRENVTGGVTTIDSDHRYIHQGKLFESFVKTTILTTGTYAIAIHTPIDKELHYRPSTISPSADKITIELFEGSTYSAGTNIPIINHKRTDGETATQAVKGGVTIGMAGTKIAQVFLPGSTGIGQTRTGGGFNGSNNEWILKKDTIYIYKITNESTESNTIQVNFFWYEEDELA